MNILITGGCGFIGSNLAERCLEEGHHVFVVDDLSTGTINNIEGFLTHPLFKFEQADITTWIDMKKWVGWADKIYHLAAVVGVYRVLAEPVNVMKTNILGFERLISTMIEVKTSAHLLFASTSSVYGHSKKASVSETDDLIIQQESHPLKFYAISKITDEAIGLAYAKNQLFPITALRLFNVIGPRQTGRYGMVVPRFVKQASANEPITVYGDGLQTRSFCDIRDVLNALFILSERKEKNHVIVNVGNDNEISINKLAELVKKLASSQSDIVHLTYEQAYGMELNDLMHRRPNLDKFYELTQYHHQWTLEQSILTLIEQLKGQHE